MRSNLLKTVVVGCTLLTLNGLALSELAQAQCQGGSQSSGTRGGLTNTANGYNQSALGNSNYTQNSLNPYAYGQQFLAQVAANDQANRYAREALAMQVQARSQMVQSQIAQAKAMRKQLDKNGAQMRKAAQKDRAEALALREEREAARLAKSYNGSERSSVRLASTTADNN